MARIPMGKRLIIMMCNIFFPPLAVLLITGLGADVLINCLLFLAAVIPSHVHGFYISWVYFGRKRRVRNGLYPGDKRAFIYSDRVNNGGAGRRELAKLKGGDKLDDSEKDTEVEVDAARPALSRNVSQRVETWDDGFDERAVVGALSRQSSLSRQTSTTASMTQPPQRPGYSRHSSSAYQQQAQQREQRPGISRQNSRQPRSPQQQQITNGTSPTSRKSRSRSRSKSLTRQAITGFERQLSRRLADREERRRKKGLADDDDRDSYDDESLGSPVAVPAGGEVRRWR